MNRRNENRVDASIILLLQRNLPPRLGQEKVVKREIIEVKHAAIAILVTWPSGA